MASPLEQFEQLKDIGKGSYGEVSLARHKRDRKQYVLKKISLKKASKKERNSAEQEAKLLSKLKHPNIVSYKDSFEKDGILYIAMQYCEGGDLYTKLKEQKETGTPLEERQVIEWFVQIAMALQYMHERNILHRDLKTQNIFLTKSKIIKVGDLGIARVLDSSTDMATTLIGTPYYMSPELFSNVPYNHKSDVWALGCCVYEMTTLKHAFNAKDMNSLVYKILKGRMPLMPKQYTTELQQLIRVMLHQKPDNRPSVNKILRDPYIKKNIATFLEETRQNRRPSSAARSRPSSSGSQRAERLATPSARLATPSERLATPSERLATPSERSAAVPYVAPAYRKPPISVPPADAPDGSDSAKLAPSNSNNSNCSNAVEEGPVASSSPAVFSKSHSRKPSDGARQDLEPIIENKEAKKEVNSSSSSGEHSDTVKAQTVTEKPSSPMKSGSSTPKRKKKKPIYLKPDKTEDADGDSKSDSSARSSGFENLKPVDKPRPLPDPPIRGSNGLPQRRQELVKSSDKDVDASNSKSSSTSSSKEDNIIFGDETPRSLPNMSARERRRQKNPTASSYDQPHSARLRLVPKEEQKIQSERYVKVEKSENKSQGKRRQPSLKDDSSSSGEETLKQNDLREREKKRESKEMKNFISLLDTTLHLNKEESNRSDEESHSDKKDEPVMEELPPPTPHSMPGIETLCNTGRLMARIRLLQEDCVKGVGYDILKKAYDILDRIEEEEVEPRLVDLMGKERFDLYAGKIWQLKFCEEHAMHLQAVNNSGGM